MYSTNDSVTLTANPDAGEGFLHWSGDAAGTQNPLTVAMTRSKVITANFSSPARLRASQPQEGLKPDGFHLTLIGDQQLTWQILASTNLATWQPVGLLTNATGEGALTDPGAVNRPRTYYRAVLSQ